MLVFLLRRISEPLHRRIAQVVKVGKGAFLRMVNFGQFLSLFQVAYQFHYRRAQVRCALYHAVEPSCFQRVHGFLFPVYRNQDHILHRWVVQALKHTLEGKEQPLSDTAYAEAMQYIIATSRMYQMKQANEQKSSVEGKQNEYFSHLEKTNPNVKKHPSGFYYEVLKEGKGPNATYAQRINFDYRSFLMLTGEPYDQTYGKRDPIIHVIGKPMFPGLVDAFQLMNAGSIYRFYFPYQLAFGEHGAGDIPGYTPFIYEIELHAIYKD